MAFFKSLDTNATRVLNLIGSTATTAEQSLNSINHYVSEHSKANMRITTDSAMMRVARHKRDLKEELDEDEDLLALYAEVATDW